MVALLAYANFQDRMLLALDPPVEPGGPPPPVAAQFARTRSPAGAAAEPTAAAAAAPTAAGPRRRPTPSGGRSRSPTCKQALDAPAGAAGAHPRAADWKEVDAARRPGLLGPRLAAGRLEPGLHGLPAGADAAVVRRAWTRSARRRSMDRVFGRTLLLGRDPDASTASTEWATAKCCSRSRA